MSPHQCFSLEVIKKLNSLQKQMKCQSDQKDENGSEAPLASPFTGPPTAIARLCSSLGLQPDDH